MISHIARPSPAFIDGVAITRCRWEPIRRLQDKPLLAVCTIPNTCLGLLSPNGSYKLHGGTVIFFNHLRHLQSSHVTLHVPLSIPSGPSSLSALTSQPLFLHRRHLQQ